MRTILSVVVLALAGLPTAMAANVGPWQSAGRVTGGSLDSLVFDPTHPGVAFAGGDGGLIYRSTDGGASWLPIQVGNPDEGFRAIALSPAGAGTLFAYSQSNGLGNGARVFRSVDDGVTWSLTAGQPTASLVDYDIGNAAAVDATGQIVLLSNNRYGIFRSTDGGATWTSPIANAKTWGIAIVPGNAAALWTTGLSAGVPAVWKSSDFGATWAVQTPAALNPPNTLYVRGYGIAVQPGSGYIFVNWTGTNPTTGADTAGVVTSRDGGATWEASDRGLAADYYAGNPASSFAFDPDDPTLVFLATNTNGGPGGMYASINSGRSWLPIGDKTPEGQSFTVAVRPGQAGYATALFAGEFDLAVSYTAGRRWRYSDKGFTSGIIGNIVDDGVSRSGYYAATSSGVFHSRNNGTSWDRISNGTGPQGYLSGVAVDRLSATVMLYAATSANVWRTADGGAHWADITPPTAAGDYFSAVYTSPVHAGEIFALGYLAFYRSTNSGTTWSSTQIGNQGDYVAQVVVSKQTEGELFAAVSSGLWKSTDDGLSWALTPSQPFSSCSYVAETNGLHPDLLVTGYGQTSGTARSANGGRSFSLVAPLSVDPETAVSYALTTSPAGDFVIANGDDGDIQASVDGGKTWLDEGALVSEDYYGTVSAVDRGVFFAGFNGALYSASYAGLRTYANAGTMQARLSLQPGNTGVGRHGGPAMRAVRLQSAR